MSGAIFYACDRADRGPRSLLLGRIEQKLYAIQASLSHANALLTFRNVKVTPHNAVF